MSYVGAFLLIMSIVAIGYQPPKKIDAPVALVSSTTNESSSARPSVDEIVANTATGSIAERANMPIAQSVAQKSISLAVKSDLAQTDDTLISKPQIIQPGSDDRKIETYVAKAGDTVQGVSEKFGVSDQTVKWANGLTSDVLDVGKNLKIPPINGLIYQVKDGDTVDSIAQKYSVNKDRLVAYNDLEISGVKPGNTIILPGAVLPETERPGYEPPRAAISNSYSSGSGSYVRSNLTATAGNRYALGNCTWYTYERRAAMGRPIGSFWGNAVSWANSAMGAGLRVDNTPEAGAIFQRGGGYGHVGIIDSVDWQAGTVTYSDMNGLRGFGAVGQDTISIGDAQARWQFIH